MLDHFIESFGRLRDELLNETLFRPLAQAASRSDAVGRLERRTTALAVWMKTRSEFVFTCHTRRI